MTTVFEYDNVVDYLKRVFDEKKRTNFSFSLRSYAKVLGMSASHLLRVLNRKKNISMEMALLISQNLQMSKPEANYFMLLAQLGATKEDEGRERIVKILGNKRQEAVLKNIEPETFKFIVEWHYLDILALVKTQGFRSEPAWVAERIGVTEKVAADAITKLLSLGLLEKTPEGMYRMASPLALNRVSEFKVEDLQEHQRQQLKRATVALQNPVPQESEFCSFPVVMNPKDMVSAKRLIQEFVDRFNEEMDNSNGTEVYQLNIQFFQASQKAIGTRRS